MSILDFFKINKDKKDKINIFLNEKNEWYENNKTFLYDSNKYYKNNCCAYCGTIFDKNINSSITCKTCNKKNIIRINPIDKSKIIILDENKNLFNEEKTKLKNINICEEYINNIFMFYPKYKKSFNDFKISHQNYSVIDITYQFQNKVILNQQMEAKKMYNKLNEILEKNVDSKLNIFIDNKKHEITNILLSLDILERNNIELLFLEKKYNIILDYLPINIYINITRFIFCWKILLKYQTNEKDIINSNLIFCNLALKLFEESNYTINDLKHSFNKQIKTKIGYIEIAPEKVWKYTEKGIKICFQHKQKNFKKNTQN